ncbi:probable disease resistance protein At1g15890 [Neltuma alba]|uniref:probable disease resistance protein At1g15890 n=1 Tax=Neltuma alba TaxID=207710 RepID=UPI0010A35C12|nr:probable disease resistance protein At1g15890 [Prosopis alba]
MDITCGSVSSFVDKFWDLVLDPTCEQFHHLFHYHRNIKQLNERLVELIDERSSIKHQIDEATNNAEPIEDKVLHWLRKVDEVSEQIQKFHEEESQAKTEYSVTSCPNPWLRYKLSKRAKAMAQEVVKICGKGNFNTVSYRVLPPSMPELFNRESNAGIGSRVQIVNQIIEELRNPSVNMIGLCGLGGVGKTTIAKEVAKSQNMFEKVILAIVSQELNVEKIQGQIAVKLGMQLNETFEEVRACHLYERLKQEKNLLLILDDLWEELDLGKVGIPFVDVENYNKKNEGCKILLTSRNETLLSNRMKCQKTIKVGFLSEDESWELFKRIAELSIDSSSPDLISIANAIVQKCRGLPLAIATAAKELLGKNPDDWKDYLARLNNPLRRNITGIREVDTILISSYDRLTSLENKHIFLLGAMLSHDPSIEDLLMHSMGLDFLKHTENMEEAHNGISAIVLLPKLERLELSNSINLIPTIWDDQLSHTSFSNLKILIVKNCGFVKLVPLCVLKSLYNLEELEVRNCHMLEMVLDFEDLNEYRETVSSSIQVVPLKKLKLYGLPKLKNVWSNHYQGNVSFPCLRNVNVFRCESLTSIFPASIAKGMLCDLEELQIDHCGADVIVAKDQLSESAVAAFEFPRLTSLQLFWLENLKNFYPQRHTLEWPQLQRLSIRYCDELEIFEKEASNSFEIHEEESTLDSKYHLLSHHKDIRNLEELRLDGKGAEMIGSGQFPAYPFPKVKLLHLSVKKATTISYKSLLKSFPKLEELELGGDIKEAFGGDEIPFPVKLTLQNLYKMKSLAPSLVSLPNLTHLTVRYSYGLTTLMTSSTARSLVHLTHLSIGRCRQIEERENYTQEIISKHEGEDDEDKEIFFNKLQYLQFDRCPRLKRFCGHDYTFRFPLLDTLIIRGCPKLEIFSPGLIDTPSLQSIQLSDDEGKRHEIWDTNLNKTIHQQRFVCTRELVLDEDDVSMIRNDQFPADCFSHVEILRIEGFVGEGVTFPYALLGRFPKLSELRVENSFFEEIFPSHNAHFIVDQIPSFRELCIANLTVLKVSECDRLVYLMTYSTAKSLVNLETLEITFCDKMEEIVMKQDGEDDEDKEIFFSKLKLLELDYLPRLKRFSGHSYTFRFPLLECVTIARCPRLTMFCPGVIYAPRLQSIRVDSYDHHKHIWMTDLNNTIQHRFMTHEVTSTAQHMVLNAENITMIRHVFPKVRILDVESFRDEGATFPYISLERFPTLHSLNVQHSSFEEIFPSQDQVINFMEKILPFKALHVSNLDKLKSIWKDDSQLPLIHQRLTYLSVNNCCNLVKLTPSSASFEKLRSLSISGCHQLVHLVTSSTTKSLVRLEWLKINECKKMKEIVMNETNEDVEGGITFNQLHRIRLIDMLSLKMFSSQSCTFEFPKLEDIEITGCPQMKKLGLGVLKTPKLSKVKIEGCDMEWENEGDLNKTIEMLSSAHTNKYCFPNMCS